MSHDDILLILFIPILAHTLRTLQYKSTQLFLRLRNKFIISFALL